MTDMLDQIPAFVGLLPNRDGAGDVLSAAPVIGSQAPQREPGPAEHPRHARTRVNEKHPHPSASSSGRCNTQTFGSCNDRGSHDSHCTSAPHGYCRYAGLADPGE
jgi:hypothetical protein